MTERAVVSVEGIFELEADRQAVAEFFRALEAEAGAGVDAGVEAEGVGLRGGIARFELGMVVHQAKVSNTVKGDIGSGGITGGNAENGERGKRLLEHLSLLHNPQ